MTWTLDNTKHRLDGRSYRDRIGRPYYGPSALRRVLDPPPSRIDRLHTWWERTSEAPAFWRLVLAMTAASIIAAALIVTR